MNSQTFKLNGKFECHREKTHSDFLNGNFFSSSNWSTQRSFSITSTGLIYSKKKWFVEEENGQKVECEQEKYIINVEAQMK